MNAEPTAAASLRTAAAPSTIPGDAPSTGSRQPVLPVCVALLILTFAIFAQTCRFDFVNYDDNVAVYENQIVRGGLTAKGVVTAFKFNEIEYWIPLTTISHMVDVQLFGMKAGGHHMTNVLLFAASVILLFLALRRLTGAFWCSAFVAAVFAVHPLRAESVAWVTERKDLLASVFFMLALLFYGPGLRRNIAVMACYILAYMCKPVIVLLPFVLLLLDYWPGRRIAKFSDWKKPVLEKLPMILLIPFATVLTVIAQSHTPGAIQSFEQVSLWARVSNALISCVIYIKQTVYPVDLVVFYSTTEVHRTAFEPVAAALVLLAITAVAFVYRRKMPYLITGWLWYIIMVGPVLGLLAIGTTAHCDRYTYFPQIGLLMMIGFALPELLAKFPRALVPVTAAALVAIALLSVRAYGQTASWKDSMALWNHTLDVNPKSLLALNNRGTVLYAHGDRNGALADFKKALEIKPTFPQANNNVGMILMELNQVDEAVTHFQTAVDKDPAFAEAENNLGSALRKQGKLEEAIAHFKKAGDIQPSYALAHYNLGKTLLLQGKVSDAADGYLAGMQWRPEFLKSSAVQRDIYQIAWTLATSPSDNARNGSKAVQLAKKASEVAPGSTALLTALAAGDAEMGKFGEAVSTAQQAIRVATEHGDTPTVVALQEQLKLYEQNRAFRDASQQ